MHSVITRPYKIFNGWQELDWVRKQHRLLGWPFCLGILAFLEMPVNSVAVFVKVHLMAVKSN